MNITSGGETEEEKSDKSTIVPVEEANGDEHCTAQGPTLFDDTENDTADDTYD